jgi:pimeloyl-ACP methyl ester carboxylesterase
MQSLHVIDRGQGDPVVLVPGIQGRWEWMEPCVNGLAEHGRVVTTSLPGEPRSGFPLTLERGFDVHLDQLDAVFERTGLESAVLCGVSYGGWISVRYAAERPERVRALVLASAPGPAFTPDARQQYYVRAPRLLLPAFLVTTRQRLRPEVKLAIPPGHRLAFLRGQLARMARAPIAPSLMARRLRLAMLEDFSAAARRVQAPTLIITGEPGLDRVVPVRSTLEYESLVPGARTAVLARTGHLGCVTRPREFASLVRSVADPAVTSQAASAPEMVGA